jgi:hypothetical protein
VFRIVLVNRTWVTESIGPAVAENKREDRESGIDSQQGHKCTVSLHHPVHTGSGSTSCASIGKSRVILQTMEMAINILVVARLRRHMELYSQLHIRPRRDNFI